MPTIQQLSQSMINKIAAGEVIERPASVVKELMENSLDAGSSRIDVSVEKGGTELIRIVDNGCGIAADQIFLALSPHATSKITDADDLFRIRTFGFRGEALASIAEISRLLLRSRTENSPEGAEIRSDGGMLSEKIPCGIPVGTSIEVENLFFNTPVRRKYMRSISTEFGHIQEAFTRIALPYPDIHFTLEHNGKIVHDLPPENDWMGRIGKIFPNEIPGNLIPVESTRSEIKVCGYVGHPKISRSNNRMQYFFLNSRHIKDRALQHALGEAFRGMLTSGRFPIAFLKIEMSPDLFDVNVHPTKMEVRFLDSQQIYSKFLGAIRERFLSVDLNLSVSGSEISPKNAPGKNEGIGPGPEKFTSNPFLADSDPRKAMDHEAVEQRRQQIVAWAKERLEEKSRERENSAPNSSQDQSTSRYGEKNDFDINRSLIESAEDIPALFQDTLSNPSREPLRLHRIILENPADFRKENLKKGDSPQQPALSGEGKPGPNRAEESQFPSFRSSNFQDHGNPSRDEAFSQDAPFCGERLARTPSGRPLVQVHDRYLIMETETGIAVIDQHALHERILYEQLKLKFESGKIDSQRLLVPVPLDLAPSESACVQENRELLANLGLIVEPFGGDTILISGYPAILEKVDPQDILLGLIDTLLESSKKPNRSDLLDEMLHQMSCKAAMKAGDKLRPDALERLMQLAGNEINSHHCPHGRPSTLLFSCEELDKMFKRT